MRTAPTGSKRIEGGNPKPRRKVAGRSSTDPWVHRQIEPRLSARCAPSAEEILCYVL